jgi:iron complex outermembrane receptor protein
LTYSNPFKLPAYSVMNAAVYYRRGRFNAQVNVSNVLDERYFIGAYDDVYVLPGEPLTVRATLS